MATCSSTVSISGGSHLKPCELWSAKTNSIVGTPILAVQRRSKPVGTSRRLSVCAGHRDGVSGGHSDFVAGFLWGGAICGRADIFSSQTRELLLNEDIYRFRRAKPPIYHNAGLEKTRETLNENISQPNSAVGNVSGNSSLAAASETDREIEPTV